MRQELRIDRILADMPHLIDGMIEGAERTRDIVDALKRFSAVDKATPEQVNLNEVVERSVRWVVQSASAKFAVRIDLPPDLRCCGSSGQLQQVVMNLVQNACDATARQAEPRLTVCGGIEQGRAVLHFIDNGPGIPEENLSRLFEPFFTTKPVGQGTGLGLSISYGIVDRHGGKLSAGNVAGGGAEFILALPLESA
jgi:two-component system sensor histidine kinase HupT/HoxJ